MNADQFGGIFRALLAAASGYVASKGWMDASTATTVAGAVGTLVVAGWSVWTNQSHKLAPKAQPQTFQG